MLAREPQPLIAAILRHSNQETWRSSGIPSRLTAHLRAAGTDPSLDGPWGDASGVFGRSRFVVREGRVFVLLLLSALEWIEPEHAPVRILLFDEDGTPLDGLRLAVEGGRTIPSATFDGSSVKIRLRGSLGAPFSRVRIVHGDRRTDLPGAGVDGELGWRVDVLDGRLALAERR
jgi:hypothetical protein